MDLEHWGRQRAQYSKARHGRDDRGAGLMECALVAATAQVLAVREARANGTPVVRVAGEAAA